MSATPSSNLGFQNFFSATLTGDITSSSTDIPMDNIPNATEGFLVIDPLSTTAREVIFYNSKTALKVVCPSVADGRGQDDTTAGAHSSGTTVIMAPVAGFWEAFQAGLAFTDNVINTSKLLGSSEFIYDFVASGCVWSGDSYASTRAASMTSGYVYIGGKRVTVAAVTARTFTASKDTYIDVDNTGTLTYTEVTNNAASPALSAGRIRLGIIVTGASNIASVGSVNQGEETKVLPIASSVAYSVTDSLGNLICPRDPLRRIIGYSQLLANFSTASTTPVQITGLSCPIIVPTGRKIKVTLGCWYLNNSNTFYAEPSVWSGTVNSGTRLASGTFQASTATSLLTQTIVGTKTLAAGAQTINGGLNAAGGGTAVIAASSTIPMYLLVELV